MKPNLGWADVAADGFKKSLQDRSDSEFGVLLGVKSRKPGKTDLQDDSMRHAQ
nr:hypothetical protein [Bradyrhizobium sp. MOS002]